MSGGLGRGGRQLGLPFEHVPLYEPDGFVADATNEAARSWLDGPSPWPDGRLALWGGEGCGKTHLLRLWAARAGAAIVPGAALQGLLPAPEAGFAVDDADAAAEAPLLHLLNAAAEAGLPVLLAARAAPARWPTGLPDLASRLRAITAVEVRPPGDDMLRVLLGRLLADRRLPVPEVLQAWMLLHLPRDPASLREAAARLDRITLARGGPVNRARVAEAIAPFGRDLDVFAPGSPAGAAVS